MIIRLSCIMKALKHENKYRFMNTLIPGGAGFMGSHFVKYILQKYPDSRVVVFDKLTYAGNLDNLKNLDQDSRFKFLQGDICDAGALDRAIEEHKVDIIVNYAAETHVDRSIMDPRAFLMTDVIGTETLLEAVRKHKLERMIQISTDEVYGDISVGRVDEHAPFRPSSPYAASKAGGDHLCHAYYRTYQTPVIVTHSCNFYGQNQYPEKLIPLFITNLLENKKTPVYGNGEQKREWIFVDDHCRAIDLILHKGKVGEAYNIGTGEEIQNIETTKLLLGLLDKDESFIEYVKDRPGHDVRYAIDHTKLTSELGWEPTVSFADGLTKTVEWYKENEEWWRKLKSVEYLEYYRKQYSNQ